LKKRGERSGGCSTSNSKYGGGKRSEAGGRKRYLQGQNSGGEEKSLLKRKGGGGKQEKRKEKSIKIRRAGTPLRKHAAVSNALDQNKKNNQPTEKGPLVSELFRIGQEEGESERL